MQNFLFDDGIDRFNARVQNNEMTSKNSLKHPNKAIHSCRWIKLRIGYTSVHLFASIQIF